MEFIKTYPNVLSDLMCENIIKFYQDSDKKKDGITTGGINKEIKNSLDLFYEDIDNSEWYFYVNYIRDIITIKLRLYSYDLNEGSFLNKKVMNFSSFEEYGFQIQEYIANEGYYNFHNDFSIKNGKYRAITFLFYLNDVEEGGETEFYNGMKIKPEKGKLLFFPASWNYPHKGNIPISNDKYILTGWLYF